MTATALESQARREIYLDRRICSATTERVELHPARSIIFLPLVTLLLGLSAFPIIYFFGDGLSVGPRLLLTLGAIVVVPASGIGLVYSVAGAHLVVDRAKQSIVLQQGYLGMGVGTQELIPFWKIDRIDVEELTPHDYRGHQDDFAQFEVSVLKLSGKRINAGMVTVRRADVKEGFERAQEIASLIADMSGTDVHVSRQARKSGQTAS